MVDAVDVCPACVRPSLTVRVQLPATGGVAALTAVTVKTPGVPWLIVAMLLHAVE